MSRRRSPPSVSAGGPSPHLQREASGPKRKPLRLCPMKDTEGKKRREKPDGEATEACLDSPVVSYTPEQRRMIRKGLRIWAKVAVRSYLRKHAAGSFTEDGSGGEQG